MKSPYNATLTPKQLISNPANSLSLSLNLSPPLPALWGPFPHTHGPLHPIQCGPYDHLCNNSNRLPTDTLTPVASPSQHSPRSNPVQTKKPAVIPALLLTTFISSSHIFHRRVKPETEF